MNRTLASAVAMAAAALPVLAPLAASAAPLAAADGLAGYTMNATAAPVVIQVYEPVLPVPATPQLEMSLSYSKATMNTGPTGQALSSALWPGDAVGEGLPTLLGNPDLTYPVKTSAAYPAGPQDAAQEPVPGTGMRAHADTKAVEATSTFATTSSSSLSSSSLPTLPALPASVASIPTPALPKVEALASIQHVTSTSRSEASDTSATATADAAASKVSLLGGLVQIDGLRVRSQVSSDGNGATTEGSVTFTGMTVVGRKVSVEADGLHPPLGGTVSLPSLPASATSELAKLGIGITAPTVAEKTAGAGANVTSRGLVVTLDTKPLRTMLDGSPLGGLVTTVTGLLPDDVQAQLVPLLALAPKFVFIVGSASSDATAAPPFDDSLPVGGGGAVAGGGTSGSLGGTGTTGETAGGGTGGADTGTGTASDAGAAGGGGADAAGADATPLSASPSAGFGGLSAGLLAFAFCCAALFGWGLRRYTALLFGPGGCDSGRPSGVPQLRER